MKYVSQQMNFLNLITQHYSVVDASEGRVFIAVYHSSNSTNLYVSNAEGLNYSFSLDDVVSPADESSWVGGSSPDIEVHVVRCLCVFVCDLISGVEGKWYDHQVQVLTN